jgi:hypothetical protein
MTATAKKWTEQEIVNLIMTKPRALEHAIVRIYERQTADEKQEQVTKHHNRRGFTPADANLLSSFARRIISATHRPEGERLSEKQQEWARKKVVKYAGQLLKVMKEKEKEAQTSLPIS